MHREFRNKSGVKCLAGGIMAELPPIVPIREIVLAAVRSAIETTGGNYDEAARRLGVSRNTVYRWVKWHRSGNNKMPFKVAKGLR